MKIVNEIIKDIKSLFKIRDKKTFIKQNTLYLVFFYLGNIFASHVNSYTGGDVLDRIFQATLQLNEMSFLPSFDIINISIGLIFSVVIKLIVYSKGKNAKKFRQGKEYGSARWGNAKDIEPYIDDKFENNILLTNTERLTMNGRPSNPKYARNKNVLIVGGSGSGKTRFFVKPNLMQMHSSYCVTDPKGTIVLECGKMLEDNGYEIKILNTINFKKSMKYNPFAYLRSEKDILKLVQTIIANTKGDGEKSGEDFWVKAEKLYYQALIGYIYYESPKEEKNFNTLLAMIDASEVREDDENFKNAIDLMFEVLEEKNPNHFAVKQYKKYKLAAGGTMKSILNNKLLKYLTCIMILLNGVLFSLVATFYMDIAYFNKLSVYPNSALYIELKTIPEEKAESTYRFLNEYAEQNGLFYIRKDYLLDTRGAVNGALLSIDGDIKSNKEKLTIDFLGQNIIHANKLEKLLDSKDENATLGVSEATLNSIDNIPRFKFGKNVVFKKLANTIKETKTVNGEYRILGLDDSKKIEFLEGISKASGVDSSVFFDGKSGYALDHGLIEIILVGMFVISNLVLLALLIVITIKYLPNLGKLRPKTN